MILGDLGPGLGKGEIVVGDFLLGEVGPGRAQQVVGDLVLLNGRLIGLHLTAQLTKSAVQPGRRLLCRVELGFHLFEQIELGELIGDGRCLGGTVRLVVDVDHIG